MAAGLNRLKIFTQATMKHGGTMKSKAKTISPEA